MSVTINNKIIPDQDKSVNELRRKQETQGAITLPAATRIDLNTTITNVKALLTVFGKQGHFLVLGSLSIRVHFTSQRVRVFSIYYILLHSRNNCYFIAPCTAGLFTVTWKHSPSEKLYSHLNFSPCSTS